MLNLGAYRPLHQNHCCYHKLFLQLVHCIELLPTPLSHLYHIHHMAILQPYALLSDVLHLSQTLVLVIFTFMPLFSTLSFHSLI